MTHRTRSRLTRTGLWLGIFLAFLPLAWGMGMIACTRTWGYSAGLALAALALAWAALHWGFSAPRPWRMAWFAVPLALLWAWALFRDAAGPVPDAARWDALKWTAALSMGLLWAHYARARAWRTIAAGLFLLVFCESFYAIFQQVNHSTDVLWMTRPVQYGMRASGTFLCPNHFANILAMAIPMAVAVMFIRGAGIPLRMLAAYTVAVALPPLYWSESRSAWLGLLAGLGAMGLGALWRRSGTAFLCGFLLVPVVSAALAWTVWSTLPQVRARFDLVVKGNHDTGDYGDGGRLKMWKDTLAMWRERPAAGYGGGSFQWVFPPWQRHARCDLLYDYPHNEYVQMLAEYGAAGLGLFVLVLLVALPETMRRVRRLSPADTDPPDALSSDASRLLVGATGATVACLLHAVFDFNFHIFPNPHFLAACLGIAWGTADAAEDGSAGDLSPAAPARPSAWPRRAAGCVLALLALAGGAWSLAGGASYWLWMRGEEAKNAFEWDIAEDSFRRSASLDSLNHAPWLGLGDVIATRAGWVRYPRGSDPADHPEITAERRRIAGESIDAYRHALALNPHLALAHYGIARVSEIAGDVPTALENYRIAAEMRPFHAALRRDIAFRLRRMGYPDEARDWTRPPPVPEN